MSKGLSVFRSATLRVSLMLPAASLSALGRGLMAQAPAAAPAAAARHLGTVTAVAGNSLTLKTDAGQEVVVSVPDGARILQLAPGSTDLKTAQTIASMSRPAVMMTKETINRAYETTLAEGIRFERRVFHSMFALEDQKEGMTAFVEKRPPNFKHR